MEKKQTIGKAFRKRLVKKREEMIGRLTDNMKKLRSGEIRRTIAAGQEYGDCAVVNQAEYLSCAQFYVNIEGIRKIDLALKRLDDGSYGLCEECGKKIGSKRLKCMPSAAFCRDCQETKEQWPARRI